jgi:MoaA/NifB/PqqE/SkfB family radical SAM enzyme
MAFIAALPLEIAPATERTLELTFVVPATDCDLKCPSCYIRARHEVSPTEPWLPVDAYARMVEAAAQLAQDTRVSIQGFEPLLPQSWPYTQQILETARGLAMPRSIVSNGTNLHRYYEELARLELSSLTISIDSHRSEAHDITRGVIGAHAKTVQGIKLALGNSYLREKIVVASMLQPRKTTYLSGMAVWLREIGVTRWVVTPVVSPKTGDSISTSQEILVEVMKLYREAKDAGITLVLDDEFSKLSLGDTNVVPIYDLRIRRIKRLDRTWRVSPSGRVSRGSEILEMSSSHLPLWNHKNETAIDFFQSLMEREHE